MFLRTSSKNSPDVAQRDTSPCQVAHIGCDKVALERLKDILSRDDILSGELRTNLSLLLTRPRSKNPSSEAIVSSLLKKSENLLHESGIASTQASEINGLIRRSIFCSDFVKHFRVPVKRPRKKQGLVSVDDVGVSDISNIPTGLDVYAVQQWRTPKLNTIHGLLEIRLEAPRDDPGLYVYVYNIPMRVAESSVVEALCNVGHPSEVILYDVRGNPMDSDGPTRRRSPKARPKINSQSNERWRANSPINGILKFDCMHSYRKAVRTENKLFGIMCRSTDPSVDPDRTIYMEGANQKKHLIFTKFVDDNETVGSFIRKLESELRSIGLPQSAMVQVAGGQESMRLQNAALVIKFVDFETAFATFKRVREVQNLATVSFNSSRSKWVEAQDDCPGRYEDMVGCHIDADS